MVTKNEQGFLHIIVGLLLFIGLIVGVIIAFAVGLDNFHQEQTNKSLFSKDAKITQIRDRVREKKEELLMKFHGEEEDYAEDVRYSERYSE